MRSTLFGDDAVGRKCERRRLDHQALGGAVGFGDEIEIAPSAQTRRAARNKSRAARPLRRAISRQFRGKRPTELTRLPRSGYLIRAEDEEVRLAGRVIRIKDAS